MSNQFILCGVYEKIEFSLIQEKNRDYTYI
jgi:hypothetical protein